MFRGAELCGDACYGWFTAVKDDSTVKRSVSTTPATTRVSTYACTNSRGRYTGSSGYITTNPEKTTVTERLVAQLEIRCLKANPKRDRRILSVIEYIRSVGRQFGVTPTM